MQLVQILLPLSDAAGRRFSGELYDRVAAEVTERYGGVTAFVWAPATGLWRPTPGRTTRDEIVVYEVMVEHLDHAWWSSYRAVLESRFAQSELVIRAHEIERL